MPKTDVIIIGAGQSGLVMSRSLSALGVEHVVLERGRTGERWLSERWDSLHLLTTNARSALPGLPHLADPEAFMPAAEFARYLARYAGHIRAPVMNGADVQTVQRDAGGYRVVTNLGQWHARAVVIATGACDLPFRPGLSALMPPEICQVDSPRYRSPRQLPEGGVLVVGASATGVQLAEEIHASGRPVTLSVGSHTGVPRRYRGKDIYEWMHICGILDDRVLENGNLEAARRQPSLQLIGSPDNRNISLSQLSKQGVALAGRLKAIDGGCAIFEDDLERTSRQSHQRLCKLLDRIDAAIAAFPEPVPEPDAMAREYLPLPQAAPALNLHDGSVRSVVWATGFTRSYPWLRLPVLDGRGELVHSGGRLAAPGLFAMGLVFMRRRRSPFIDGCGLDAEELAPEVKAYLESRSSRAA